MKNPFHQSIPPKLEHIGAYTLDFKSIMQEYIRRTRKILRQHGDEKEYGYSQGIMARRIKALEKYTPDFIKRYETDYPDPYYFVDWFYRLNLFAGQFTKPD